MKKLTLLVLFLACTLAYLPSAAAWYSNYSYRRPIYGFNSGLSGSVTTVIPVNGTFSGSVEHFDCNMTVGTSNGTMGYLYYNDETVYVCATTGDVAVDTLINQGNASNYRLADNLALWLNMNGSYTDLATDNTVVNQGSTNATGYITTGADFEADSSQYMQVTTQNSMTFTDGFTVSYWMKEESSVAQGMIIDSRIGTDEIYIYMGTSTPICNIYTDQGSGEATSTIDVTTGEWAHVVCRHNSTNTCVFVNGTIGACIARTGTPTAWDSNNVHIGASQTPDGYYDGMIDEFKVWNRSLTNDEILALYEANVQLGAEEVGGNPVVSITLPANSTYGQSTNHSLTWEFTPSSVTSSPCNTSFYSVDGAANVSMGCVNTTFSETTTGTHYITIWANDTDDNSTSATQHFTIESPLIACTDPDAVEAVNFTFWNEDNTSESLNGSAEYAMHITSSGITHTYNESHTNVTNITICIPNGSAYTANMTMLYRSSGYEQRTYYFYSATLDATVDEISLYCIDTTDGEKLEATARDANDNTVSDVYIDMDRYYPETDDYETVAILRTDSTGKALTYLDLDDVFYRFTLSQAGIVVNSYGAMTITDTSDDPETITFYVAAEETQFFEMREDVGYSCYFNTTTNITSCSVTDPSGLVTSARLLVERQTLTGFTNTCEDTDSGTSFTLTCALGSAPNGSYRYFLEVTPVDNPPYIFFADTIEFPVTLYFGNTGVFAAFIAVAVLGMLAVAIGPVAAILAVIGLIAATLMGLIDIGIGSLVSLLIVGALIFMKGRGI